MIKRVIPVMLIENGELIKTKQFDKPNYIGDPLNAIKIYNEFEVDEICVIDKSAYKNGIDYHLIAQIAEECFSPVAYGGGIHDFSQIERILKSGIEKVVLSSALSNQNFVNQAVEKFGSSTIAACIDYKIVNNSRKVFVNNGQKPLEISLNDFVDQIVKCGVGEIILQNIDADGMYSAYDTEGIVNIINKHKNPFIILGGCASLEDIEQAFEKGVSACAAGSLFVYYTKSRGILINYPVAQEFITHNISR